MRGSGGEGGDGTVAEERRGEEGDKDGGRGTGNPIIDLQRRQNVNVAKPTNIETLKHGDIDYYVIHKWTCV